MGILNVTPDSFADARAASIPERAVDAALRMEADGADLIDIGGESTRPGAEPVSADEELRARAAGRRGARRAARASRSRSTPTRPTWRARRSTAGAAIVNDVSGLQRDPALARRRRRDAAPR